MEAFRCRGSIKRYGIKADTLAAAFAFVIFFIISDVWSTALVIRHFGESIIVYEINIFVHLASLNGLVSMKLAFLIFFTCALVVFSRHQEIIGEVMGGLAIAGIICSLSNAYFLFYGYAPTVGGFNSTFFAGVAISISAMCALMEIRRKCKSSG